MLGLVQNAYVAGAPRKLRVRLGYKGTVAEEIVVRTLVMVEEKYSKLGSVVKDVWTGKDGVWRQSAVEEEGSVSRGTLQRAPL